MSRSKDSNQGQSLARWATALVAIAGMIAAWYLTDLHIQVQVDELDSGGLCDAHSSFDCQSAIHSDFSELFGIPISLLGLAFYASILALAIFETPKVRGSSNAFRPAAIAVVTFGFGVAYSIFLAIVSIVEVGSICPFCAMLYVVNIVGFVAACFWAGLWPRDVVKAQVKDTDAFFNGWTGLFALSFGIMLVAGMIYMEGAIDDRVVQEEQAGDELAELDQDMDADDIRSMDAPAKGPEDAPVTIVEFSNFTCPFCAQLAEVLEQVVDEYEDEVRVEFRHFPLDTQGAAHAAARGAHCADDQGQFWEVHEVLFANLGNFTSDGIPGLAEQVDGLDIDEFETCLDDSSTRARVDEDVTMGRNMGIQGTPTFFVNGERFQGAVEFDDLSRVVERELAQAED